MSEKESKKKKVVFFIPNLKWHNKRPWKMVTHSTLTITALLKDDFDFSILDANGGDLSKEECVKQLKELNPGVVLVSGVSVEYHQTYHSAVSLAKSACPSCITIMGGTYPTVMEGEVLNDKNLDYIFLRHAEERINRFINLILEGNKSRIKDFEGIGYRDESGKVVITPINTFISDVKKHVKPDYSMIDITPYLNQDTLDYQFNSKERTTVLMTSYGCPHNCVFCASRTINGRKTSFRPVEDVMEEIDYLVDKYKIKHIVFLDDCILSDRKRIEKILNSMIERKYDLKFKLANVAAWNLKDDLLELLKKAGCEQITISVESGSERVLREIIRKPIKLETIPHIVKECRELGIDMGVNFVIGFPGETWDEIRETFRFAEKIDADLVHFHIATPLPKTDLYELAKEQNLLPKDFSFTNPDYFGFGRGFIETDEFSPFELHILRSFEWDRINFSRPDKIKKVAKMMGISVEQLNEHRKNTRKKCGIHY